MSEKWTKFPYLYVMNAANPQLSVILPVRNAAASLARAVESCLTQTFDDVELIIIDNQSEDGTAGVLSNYSDDSRVRLMSCDGGLVQALRAGCDASRAPFLARMDADDVSRPTRFGTQLAFLAKHPDVAVCGCGVQIPNADASNAGMQTYVEWCNHLHAPEDHLRERFIESPMVHPSVVMRREAFEDVGGYADPEWAEDYDLWLRFMDRGYGLAKVPEVLLEWTDGPHRLTRQHPRYAMERFLEAKAAYISRIDAVLANGVTICGAGPIGKRIARLLLGHGVTLHRFMDVNPRRIGRTLCCVPVAAQDDLTYDGSVLLSAVGQPGARDRVRTWVSPYPYREGIDFFCVA